MRAYVETTREDWAICRVARRLAQHAPPSVEIVSTEAEADLVVKHIIGRRNRTLRRTGYLLDAGKEYAVIQYALRSTKASQTSEWLPIWRRARLVWSYYDLPALCRKDWTPIDFPFYHAPLGVDAEVFKMDGAADRPYIIGTSGLSPVTESVREARIAARHTNNRVFHLGPDMGAQHVEYQSDISDQELAALLNRCVFVAGLRRTEGFEMMAAEGVLCGARPILFNRSHYRQWHDQWGVFIREGDRKEVVAQLEEIFVRGTEPVSVAHRQAAMKLFDWETIIAGFWDGCTHG